MIEYFFINVFQNGRTKYLGTFDIHFRIWVFTNFGMKIMKLLSNSVLLDSRSYFRITGSTMSFTSFSGGNLVDGLPPGLVSDLDRTFRFYLPISRRWQIYFGFNYSYKYHVIFFWDDVAKYFGSVKNVPGERREISKWWKIFCAEMMKVGRNIFFARGLYKGCGTLGCFSGKPCTVLIKLHFLFLAIISFNMFCAKIKKWTNNIF